MKVIRCASDFGFKKWQCSGMFGNNTWTALTMDGYEVIPILDAVEWGHDTVNLGICSYCGGDDGPTRWVNWTRLGDWIWITPQPDSGYSGVDGQPLNEDGSLEETILVHTDIWNDWHDRRVVDAPATLARALTYRELKNVWVRETWWQYWMWDDEDVVADLRRGEFVTELDSRDDFIALVQSFLATFANLADEPVAGSVVDGMPEGASTCSAWFIEPEDRDWHAFVRSADLWRLRLGPKHSFAGADALSRAVEEQWGDRIDR